MLVDLLEVVATGRQDCIGLIASPSFEEVPVHTVMLFDMVVASNLQIEHVSQVVQPHHQADRFIGMAGSGGIGLFELLFKTLQGIVFVI